LGLRQQLHAAEVIDQGDQRRRGQDRDLAGPGGFRSAGLRADQAQARSARRHGPRQGAGHRRDAAVEGKLAHRRPAGQRVGRHNPHGGHDRKGDGQVVVAADLGQVGRSQVDDDPLAGKPEAQAGEGGAYALAAFRHRLVAKTDDGEGEFAGRKLHLNVDAHGLDALERPRRHPCGHAVFSPSSTASGQPKLIHKM
jgi:hypothetical protein